MTEPEIDYVHKGHKCDPLARMFQAENRDWWLGQLTEPIAGYPQEKFCLHIQTPIKTVVLGMNDGDWQQLVVLAYVALGKHVDHGWVERISQAMRERANTQPEEAR